MSYLVFFKLKLLTIIQKIRTLDLYERRPACSWSKCPGSADNDHLARTWRFWWLEAIWFGNHFSVFFYGLFKQHGIGFGYQWCDHGCSWLCLHTNSTEIIVWAKSQSLLSNALHLIFIIFSLAQVLKLSNHEGKTASSSYRIPRPP